MNGLAYNSRLIIACKAFITGLCFYGALVYAEVPLGRDPTEPSGFVNGQDAKGAKSASEESSGLELGAVLISGDDKFAIINNKLVRVGDAVGSNKVKKIDAYHVTLVGETGETVLELFGRSIKEPAK